MSEDFTRDTKPHNDPRLYLIESAEGDRKRYLVASVLAELRPDQPQVTDGLIERFLKQSRGLRVAQLPAFVAWTNGNLNPAD